MRKVYVGLLMAVILSCQQANAQFSQGKKDINGVEGVLTLHPDSVSYQGKDGNLYYFFYDLKRKTLFITSNKKIYQEITNHLPARMTEGNEVKLEGATLKAFTDLFSKEQMQEEGSRLGFNLKRFKIARIFNYGLKGAKPETWF